MVGTIEEELFFSSIYTSAVDSSTSGRLVCGVLVILTLNYNSTLLSTLRVNDGKATTRVFCPQNTHSIQETAFFV